MKKIHLIRFIESVNIPKKVCHILLGHEHTRMHRLLVGAVVMLGTIALAKVATKHAPEDIHFVIEAVAGLVHAMGATPYLEMLIEEV